MCEITKYISFHLARHTFATTIILNYGVPIETVSKMLGHKQISTTQIYAEVDEDKLRRDMFFVEAHLASKQNSRRNYKKAKISIKERVRLDTMFILPQYEKIVVVLHVTSVCKQRKQNQKLIFFAEVNLLKIR